MPSINLLDAKTYNKIAAGEVVERPSSCVKELLENAIDAGAKKIRVEIEDGGIGKIQITDNGVGMDKEDLKNCVLPHATSKIETIDDLLTVSTLGFRGEALASVAAVSKLKITTKRKICRALTRLKWKTVSRKSLTKTFWRAERTFWFPTFSTTFPHEKSS